MAGCGRGLRLGCRPVHSAVRGSCRAPRLRLRGLCRALATALPRRRALRSQMRTGAAPLVYVQVQARALWSQQRVHSLNISSWQQRPSLPLAHQSLANKTLSLLPAFSLLTPPLISVLGQLRIDENLVVGLALCLHRRALPIQRAAVQVQPAPHPPTILAELITATPKTLSNNRAT